VLSSADVARRLMLIAKRGKWFVHAEIQESAIRELRAITESAFQEAFQ
jgi:hypothetical protein